MTGSLADLLHDQLRDLHDAEAQYGHLLPRMIQRANNATLKSFLRSTEEQTHENLGLLTRVCCLRGICPEGVPCTAMAGLVREFGRPASEPGALDAAIIANARRVSHYEIAGFVTASFVARCLHATEASCLLTTLADAAWAREQALTRIDLGQWQDAASHRPVVSRQVPVGAC